MATLTSEPLNKSDVGGTGYSPVQSRGKEKLFMGLKCRTSGKRRDGIPGSVILPLPKPRLLNP